MLRTEALGLLQFLKRSGDEGKRSAEVVAHVGKEHQLGASCFLKLPGHFLQFSVSLFQYCSMLCKTRVHAHLHIVVAIEHGNDDKHHYK